MQHRQTIEWEHTLKRHQMDQRGTEATTNRSFHNFDDSLCSVAAVMNIVYSELFTFFGGGFGTAGWLE